MVDVAPFRALRYSVSSKSNDISKFISPPYDVISLEERSALAKKSSTNIVELELPSGKDEQKYNNARALYQEWQKTRVLMEDFTPSFYVMETAYRIKDPFAPASLLKRYGVMVALRLEPPGKGAVRPHERTLPKAKEDRLHLLKGLEANVSPVFGLFFDSKKEWRPWIKKVTGKKPIAVGREKKDLEHKLWKVEEPAAQGLLQRLLKSKELYIADGHHRYEVAWAYKGLRLQEDPQADARSGWNYVMAYICPMEEPGLLMLPTHRLVKSEKTFEEWKSHVERVFQIKAVKNQNAVLRALAKPAKRRRTLGWFTYSASFLLELRPDISIDRCLAHRPEALRSLDAVLLQDLVLDDPNGTQFVKDKNLIYTRDMDEIKNVTKKDKSWTAFVLSSPGVRSLAHVASAGEVMPPKTTYFYPKVPTGFTLMPLSQRIGSTHDVA